MEMIRFDQLSTLSHPQRMDLFRLLLRRYPDAVPAGEIGTALGLKPSTASVYLAALREAGLITQTREGRSLLYRADVAAVQGLMGFLFNDCCRGRPDLCPPEAHNPMQGDPEMTTRKYNVLFICTGNSARSIIAETLLRALAGDRFEAYSAGTRPYSELNPIAVEMLRDKGLDTTPLRAKHISEFWAEDAPRMDFVFTVCDRAANEDCPAWAGQPISAHWGLPDPVKATGTQAQKRLAFQQVYGMLKHRLAGFTALPLDTLDRISLQAAVDRIGQTDIEDHTA
ncbi:helix-turn-helix domain-containing protein [Salipiger sp. P9]|uniref:arsenate reductase/protein-tyrosine-phosphatase family protein n=1 Tax=Salipiger pentaromativorans TaxID=2943193 RepID=UPI002157BA0B|nr:helix-turn-helix domain-containing protein [Salipiger pentaromativorans]MCR8547969.1 helix-turn-helix domain-containing protein [Salipiger pentaromativorans]